ncbi:WecB/TagA/CpsF family glycosyltransferase [Enterococcus sp. AD013-P3]|uniref:WecB/TagA/CpsF family glycosyltransferase n=1 Tax=Enterococcus sp. AD013-P3 TaxID=3411036 RepID=UPI003B949934
METEYISGLPVDNLSRETILNDLPIFLASNKKMIITSVNPQITLQAERYPKVKSYIERASHRIPDGVGVVKMSKYLGGNIKQRVTGIDVMDDCLRFADDKGYRIFLYGAKEDVVEKAVSNITSNYPNLIVAGAIHGYTSHSQKQIIKQINDVHPTFLFVALGSPKQELFLEESIDQLNASVYLDVGGTFDVLAGVVKRAPEIFIKMNLEWLYRSLKYHRPERLRQIPQYVVKSWQLRKHTFEMRNKEESLKIDRNIKVKESLANKGHENH